jgi:hypothetical protein
VLSFALVTGTFVNMAGPPVASFFYLQVRTLLSLSVYQLLFPIP